MSLMDEVIAEIHPIEIVESLALSRDWDFDRVADDQIAMAIKGQWETYSITIAWSKFDETLRLISTFEMDPSEEHLPALYELLNLANDKSWIGAFSFWKDQKLMTYRYGLCLAKEKNASPEQIDQMIGSAIITSECFYPAFQLVCSGHTSPEQAFNIAIGKTYGRA